MAFVPLTLAKPTPSFQPLGATIQPETPQKQTGIIGGVFDYIKSIPSQIKDAAVSSFQQGVQGATQIQQGGGALGGAVAGLEGALKVGAGVAGVVFSPIAPVMTVLNKAIELAGSGLAETPLIKDYAKTATETDVRVLEALQNLGGIAMGILGAKAGDIKLKDIPTEKLNEIAQHPKVVSAVEKVMEAQKVAEAKPTPSFEPIKSAINPTEAPVAPQNAPQGTITPKVGEVAPTTSYDANSGIFANNGARSFSDTSSYRANSAGLTDVATQMKGSFSKSSTVDIPTLSLKIVPEDVAYLNKDFRSIVPTIYGKAAERANAFAGILKEHGSTVSSINIKAPDSFFIKAVAKAKTGVDYLSNPNDVVRGTTIVKNEADATAFLKSLGDKVATFDNYFEKPKGGYKGINADLRLPDGSLAELQIHTKESLANAEAIHEIYKGIKPEVAPAEVKTEPIAGAPKPIESAGSPFTSRVFERMKAENPEVLTGDLTVQHTNLLQDAQKAVDLIAKDKQQAFDIAMGAKSSPDVTSTAVNIAMTEKALADGNNALAARLIKNRSLEQTRRGQEIVAERGSVTDNSTAKYVKELVAARLDALGKNYLDNLKLGKRVADKTKALARIDKEVAKVEAQIKGKKLDVKTALALLDKLACV